jgi:hypothetical protein
MNSLAIYGQAKPRYNCSGGANMKGSIMKNPSAWLPVAMSMVALLLVLGHLVLVGVVHEADEGTPAHIWQLLMAGQIPLVLYFALMWLPRSPGQALRVVALQVTIALASLAAVFLLT